MSGPCLPIKDAMPIIQHEEQIDVRAPAASAFAVISRDILAVDDDPDAMTGHRPLVPGPLREGFRWRQRVVHNRRHCRIDWLVTRLEPGRLLEQSMDHYCADLQKQTRGGERWEFAELADGTTRVTLREWRVAPGLDGWLRKLLGSNVAVLMSVELRKRLAYVQFAAERS
jgi:hypothetical protein